MLKIDLDGVPGSYRPGDTIYRWYVRQFFLESAKPFIPEYKYLPVVLVYVFRVNGMMHPVM